MPDRTIEEIVASVETHIIYINNHLQNIDSHLERLNNNEDKQNNAITKNTTKINLVIRIAGGLLAGGGIVAAITLGIMQLVR